MSEELTSRLAAVVGRESELQSLRDFLSGVEAAACQVLSGEPGIGKTTIWEYGLDLARENGFRVLSTRASEAETALSFAALADLVDDIDGSDLDALPAPQLRALQVALLLANPSDAPPDPFAICTAFLNAVRIAAARTPVLIAVDDVQWLDQASSEPLIFAARRLSRHGVRFLLTRRPSSRSELERVLDRVGAHQLDVGGMSIGATGRMITDQLGYAFSRRTLRRLHEGAQGNPLLALEIARMLGQQQPAVAGAELPIPDIASNVFGTRVREAAEATRRVLLAVALGGATVSELAGIIDPLALDDAVASGLVIVDRTRVRPAHPMLAAAARKQATAAQRRALHQELASVATDPISRARHLAVATTRPDADLAESVAEAADLAASHGRVWDAVELGQQALRLTPAAHAAHGDRVLALAGFRHAAGDIRRMTELLRAQLGELQSGRQRAHAYLLLAVGSDVDVVAAEELVDQAVTDAGSDRGVRAWALSRRAELLAGGQVVRLDEAQELAREAVAIRSGEQKIDRHAVETLVWTHVLRGHPVADLVTYEAPSNDATAVVLESIDRALGVRLAFKGELEQARSAFRRLVSLAEERGETHSIAAITLQQCEVELRAGHLREVDRFREQLEEVFRDTDLGDPARWSSILRVRALAAAITGDPAEAARCAAEVLNGRRRWASHESPGWEQLETHRALGIAALFERDAVDAVQHLRYVWAHTRREHIDDPGAFPAAGDLVDALVLSGDLDEAGNVVNQLRQLADDQDHPWGQVTAQRGESLIALMQADDYRAQQADDLARAANAYGELGFDFDRARTLLSLGVIQRRFKKRAAARLSLEQAADGFDRCGSLGWANQGRDELDRVSGRRRTAETELTPAERRVAELAASGLSNKEIAAQLVVSVNTVEGQLSRVYDKLGVRSRRHLRDHIAENLDV